MAASEQCRSGLLHGWSRYQTQGLLRCDRSRPPLGPNTDHDATKQDCHVPEYIDAALARVAANHPDLVSVTPKFEAISCSAKIDGIHLHEQNGPAGAAIAAYYKSIP